MRMRRMSDREIKLLLAVLIMAILFGAYQSGYQRFHRKASGLRNENSNMAIQKNELLQKQLRKDEIIVETARLKDKTELILSRFPPAITQEKSMMFIIYLTQLSGMKLTSISFHDISPFYTPDRVSNTSPFDGTALSQNTAAMSGGNTAPSGQATVHYGAASEKQDFNITGYKTAVSISYQATYSGLKKCLSLIANNKERMNVGELTASFDNATGNLTGIMTIKLYALEGIEGDYEEPDFDGIDIGTSNIFSTFELYGGVK